MKLPIILSTLTFALSVFATPLCSITLSSLSPDDRFIAYLSKLVEQNIITDLHLRKLREDLESGRLRNPFSSDQAEIESKTAVHRVEIDRYIDHGLIDIKRLKEWVESLLNEKQRVQTVRTSTKEETSIFQKMEFVPIQGGEVYLTTPRIEKVPIRPFEIMTTPVTQKQWFDVMEDNPSAFVDGINNLEIKTKDKSVKMLPNNPVENFTWWSALEFANRLSKQAGLQPAYDLSHVVFDQRTHPEDGTLKGVFFNREAIFNLSKTTQNSDGYRLPTTAELEYILEEAFSSGTTKLRQTDSSKILNYFWLEENSNTQTQPVADLSPVQAFGRAIYDIAGNVSVWTSETFGESVAVDDKLTFGVYYRHQAPFWFTNRHDRNLPSRGSPTIGLRLVRTLK